MYNICFVNPKNVLILERLNFSDQAFENKININLKN